MYRKKLKWTCEECGDKTYYLSLREDGKHVCDKCMEVDKK